MKPMPHPLSRTIQSLWQSRRMMAMVALTIAASGTGSPARETSAVLEARSPIEQPYEYVSHGSLSGPEILESPDPLVAYRWKQPRPGDDLQIYVLSPSAVSTDREESFENLQSLTGKEPKVIVKGAGAIRVDFGVESAAWVEFDSPDCPGHVEMSISEYNEPFKTRAPVKHGNTWRLELNRELYDGVRFAWIHVKSTDKPWHITGIRAVCQVKPTNYAGSFSCSDPGLTKAWYMSAYSVKASLCKDYFGAILMDRGDRMSWTGDAHPIQAAALIAFANHDFIRKNIENTSGQDNGIRSYALYWVLSLLDYYRYTGDAASLKSYMDNACAKLDSAYAVFGQDPPLRFYGWDERLCAGFELWFKPAPEAQLAYKMLSIRAWSDFAKVMGESGRTDLRDKYHGYASEKMAELRKSDTWTSTLGLHSGADAINTGYLTKSEQDALFEKLFRNRVNRLSFSPFNQYFIIQAMARMGKHDDALSSVRDMWGGMLQNGATTPYEVFHPSWNGFLGPNDRVPNSQSGVTSLCHPWGAGVVKWLNEEVLGIVPTQPGFTTYDILPHPGRTLTHVSGETPTPLGTIRANFDFASGHCHVTAPQGCIGRVGIPKLEKTIAKIMINGTLAWDGSPHAVPGIGGVAGDAEYVVFTGVQPGTYDFVVDYRGTTPAYDEPAVEYAAESLKPDTTTGGNWGGLYGKEGHILCNYHGEGRDEKQLPAYVKSLDYFRAFPKTKNCVPDPVVWENDTSDKRALARNSRNDRERNATGYSNRGETMTVTIGIDGPRDYQIALYFVDWKKQGARQVVEMMDADSLNPIAPVRMLSDHSDGIYLIYKYDRSVKFRINKVRGDVSSLSGIFFDPASPVPMIKDSTTGTRSGKNTVTVTRSDAKGIGVENGVMRRDPSDIIKVGDFYYVWYSKGTIAPGYDATIWYATSPDGCTWTEKGMALAKGTPGDWDGASVFTSNILVAEERFDIADSASIKVKITNE